MKQLTIIFFSMQDIFCIYKACDFYNKSIIFFVDDDGSDDDDGEW